MPAHAVLITLLNVLLIMVAMQLVASARGRHQVKAPATTGPVEFERAFRAHQNTLEATVMFLPTLWIATTWSEPTWTAILGYAWLLGRAWYLHGYVFRAGKRGGGFMLAFLANVALLLLGLYAVIPALAT
jgi:glutathione S-transferase